MDQEMILISKEQVKHMLTLLHRAEGYCSNAQSTPSIDSGIDVSVAEPWTYYPGASGYALGTMRDVICTLETHL